MSPKEIPEALVEQTRTWLGRRGRKFFRDLKDEHGTVSPVLIDGRIPHPVHFR